MPKTKKSFFSRTDLCRNYQILEEVKTGKPFESYEACMQLTNKNKKTHHYKNTEVQKMKGGKLVREVSVKNGKGFKKVTRFQRGRKVGSVKKALPQAHVTLILNRRFIPGLFSDCHAV